MVKNLLCELITPFCFMFILEIIWFRMNDLTKYIGTFNKALTSTLIMWEGICLMQHFPT